MKALMMTYKETKEYTGSESEPWITPAHYLARYFLDDYTEIDIEGDTIDWTEQEFKSMLSSMKITPQMVITESSQLIASKEKIR